MGKVKKIKLDNLLTMVLSFIQRAERIISISKRINYFLRNITLALSITKYKFYQHQNEIQFVKSHKILELKFST